MNLFDMIQLMEKAKELGASEFSAKENEFHVRFKDVYVAPASVSFAQHPKVIVPEVKSEELVKPLSSLDEMTEDEILYYATPYFDQLQAQKAEQAEKLKET